MTHSTHRQEIADTQRLVRRMATRALWSTNAVTQVEELRAENNHLRAALDEKEADLSIAYEVIAQLQMADICGPPPRQLVQALRFGFERADIMIGEQEVAIGLSPVPRGADPVGEALAWARHVEAHRSAPSAGRNVPRVGRANLPSGHCYQAWRNHTRAIVVLVNSACDARCARTAMHSAIAAMRAS